MLGHVQILKHDINSELKTLKKDIPLLRGDVVHIVLYQHSTKLHQISNSNHDFDFINFDILFYIITCPREARCIV